LRDPFENQFHLPTALVDVGDGLGLQIPDVGVEYIGSAGFGTAISDQSQGLERPGLFLFAGEFDTAIEADRHRANGRAFHQRKVQQSMKFPLLKCKQQISMWMVFFFCFIQHFFIQ
jgi:hypothetical protein